MYAIIAQLGVVMQPPKLYELLIDKRINYKKEAESKFNLYQTFETAPSLSLIFVFIVSLKLKL